MHCKPVLGVIEPLVIRVDNVHMHTLLLLLPVSLLFFVFFLMHGGIRTTIRVAFPLTVDRILRPGLRKNLANIQAVEMRLPVFESHPPVVILIELVIQK